MKRDLISWLWLLGGVLHALLAFGVLYVYGVEKIEFAVALFALGLLYWLTDDIRIIRERMEKRE